MAGLPTLSIVPVFFFIGLIRLYISLFMCDVTWIYSGGLVGLSAATLRPVWSAPSARCNYPSFVHSRFGRLMLLCILFALSRWTARRRTRLGLVLNNSVIWFLIAVIRFAHGVGFFITSQLLEVYYWILVRHNFDNWRGSVDLFDNVGLCSDLFNRFGLMRLCTSFPVFASISLSNWPYFSDSYTRSTVYYPENGTSSLSGLSLQMRMYTMSPTV